MNNYAHLHPTAAEQLEKSLEDRIAWLKVPRWIGYPRAKEILAKLDDLVTHPREPRMPNIMLVGNTNSGKTRLIRQFVQRHPADENPGGDYIVAPVLLINAPPGPSEDGIYVEILQTLFEHVPASSTDARRNRVCQVLSGIQLKVLVIDDLHNILAGTTTKTQIVLNMLKYLGNKLQISIVGCGTGDLPRAISISPEIENRFKPEILPRWQLNTPYRQLLASFEAVLPLKQPSNLSGKEMAAKILAMSEGATGEISTLLVDASKLAISSGTEMITPEILNGCGFVPPSDRKQLARQL